MSTVRSSCWASATARLKAMVVLPTPPFGAKTDTVAGRRDVLARRELLLDAGDAVHQVEAGERHRQHGVDALPRGRCRPGSGARSA